MRFGNHGQALLLRRSVTFDNGTEFARRYRLHAKGIRTYFCECQVAVAERGS